MSPRCVSFFLSRNVTNATRGDTVLSFFFFSNDAVTGVGTYGYGHDKNILLTGRFIISHSAETAKYYTCLSTHVGQKKKKKGCHFENFPLEKFFFFTNINKKCIKRFWVFSREANNNLTKLQKLLEVIRMIFECKSIDIKNDETDYEEREFHTANRDNNVNKYIHTAGAFS